MELPEPTAQGDLARTPFAHALLYVEKHGLTGSLVVWAPRDASRPGQDRIRFVAGRPVAARFVERAAAIDRGFLPLFRRADGPYAFYADIDLVGAGDDVREGQVDPWRVIAASLRGPSRDDVVGSVLAAFGDLPLRLKPAVDLNRFDLLPKERVFIDVIRAGAAPVAELAATCELGVQAGQRLLYLLAITGTIEPYEAPTQQSVFEIRPSIPPSGRPSRAPAATASGAPPARPASEAPPVPDLPVPSAPPPAATKPEAAPAGRGRNEPSLPPPPPPGLSPAQLEFWAEVSERAIEIDRQNYFQMLGVPTSASAETIRKAYFALVKKWHPDRVPKELDQIRRHVERIFAYFTRANDTLSDETKRGRYLATVQDGGGTPEADRELAAIVDAAMELQKAEVLIRRRDWAGAMELVQKSLELNPEEADAHAAFAWVLFNQEKGNARVREMLAAVDRAIQAHDKNDRAHFYRGNILRRMGKEGDAIAAFERAAELNPRNVDAIREVRIAKMRGNSATSSSGGGSMRPGSSSPAPKQEGGLLSRLFGSSKKP